MTKTKPAYTPIVCTDTEEHSWKKGFSAWVKLARFCNKYFPRGKSYFPRLIGKVFGKNLQECIQTQKGAFLTIEPTSLDVYAMILNRGGVWDKNVFDTCSSLLSNGQVFYDIGANVGIMSIEIAKTFEDQVTVIAFEPQTLLAKKISISAKLNKFSNFQVFDVMVGATKGESELYLSSHSIPASSKARQKNAVEIKTTMTTIDDLVSTATIPPPNDIKLDIEGGELCALSGAKKTITDHQPCLVFESDENMSRFGYSRKDLLDLIGSLGSYDFFFINSLNNQHIKITDSNISDAYTDILATPCRSKQNYPPFKVPGP